MTNANRDDGLDLISFNVTKILQLLAISKRSSSYSVKSSDKLWTRAGTGGTAPHAFNPVNTRISNDVATWTSLVYELFSGW
jgi:hypothetical protein